MLKLNNKWIKYKCPTHLTKPVHKKSIEVFGFDTEADINGNCFLMCTSEDEYYHPAQFPNFLFNRLYRGKHFVIYNLKYDEGFFVKPLPKQNQIELWKTGKTKHNSFLYKAIPGKIFTISKDGHTVNFWDMFNFFKTSLNKASQEFLGRSKLESPVESYTEDYIKKHFNEIVEYCINDAKLVRDLALLLISKFEQFGVFPQKLYSTAHISYHYFKQSCDYPVIREIFYNAPRLIESAMSSYAGGKFEVTTKGCGNFHEYDIISAYPYETSKLEQIYKSKIYYTSDFINEAWAGFLYCKWIHPAEIPNPIPLKRHGVNYYGQGKFEKWITITEYRYLKSCGIKISFSKAWFLVQGNLPRPFENEIKRLVKLKSKLKKENKLIEYHLIKILLNSLYGKFVQLIEKDDYFEAGPNWNPIYGAMITAGTRVKISEMQLKYPTILAVHTDSIISDKPLKNITNNNLGDFEYSANGNGVIIGSGVYQIGEKTKLRGFVSKTPLLKLIQQGGKTIKIAYNHAHTWREIVFRGGNTLDINRFENLPKKLVVNFDTKRLWIKDYEDFSEISKRRVDSVPLPTLFSR